MRSTKLVSLAAVTALLAACQLPPISIQMPAGNGKTVSDKPQGSPNDARLSALQGTVRVPPGYQGAGGDPFAQAGFGSAGLISAGGMNYRLKQAEERPLANALVMLADAAGNPLPGFEPTVTDAEGNFRFLRVPQDFTYVVMAAVRKDGKVAYIKSLAQAGAEPVAVDAATTLVTVSLLKGTKDGGLLGRLNIRAFRDVVKKVSDKIKDTGTPDLTDEQGLIAAADQAVDSVGVEETMMELRDAVKERRNDGDETLRDQRARGVVVDDEGTFDRPEGALSLDCEEAFKLRDLDGDGAVTWEEMRKGLLIAMEQARTVRGPNDTTGLGRPPVALPAFDDERAKREFLSIDRDGDGRITLGEVCDDLPIAPPRDVISGPCLDQFKQLDADGDGLISFEEYTERQPNNGLADVETMRGGVKETFLKLDRNGDGKVSFDEFCGEMDPCSARFAAVAGDDWLIDPREGLWFEWSPEKFKGLDRNGDGLIDRAEFGWGWCGDPGIAPPIADRPAQPSTCDEAFAKLAGLDGFLDSREALFDPMGQPRPDWSLERFKKYDRNGDGRVDRREYGWASCGENELVVDPSPIELCNKDFFAAAGTDGMISPDEASRLQWDSATFKKYDRNGDGSIDRLEYGWAICGEQPMEETPITLQPLTRCQERFYKAAGSDNRIDWTEARLVQLDMEVAGRSDWNKDGYIDLEEFTEMFCSGDDVRP